uniref:Pancreatic trypsin inhibitor n=1 Tax=Rhipicephalus zambeziensis TaxID=60191 RepID=A0A224Y875_9ACAR
MHWFLLILILSFIGTFAEVSFKLVPWNGLQEEEPKLKGKRCTPPPDEGVCRAYMPRWYYDASRNVCSTFIYGGCGGNRNNFQSETDCQRRCMFKIRKNKTRPILSKQ